jgi:hypothetical protein
LAAFLENAKGYTSERRSTSRETLERLLQ